MIDGGDVACWGHNGFGQLGNGLATPWEEPVMVQGLKRPTDLALGEFGSCAIVDRQVSCWGRNLAWDLGVGNMPADWVPVAIDGLGAAIDVAVGKEHMCALADDGTVRCWGSGGSGELGNGRNPPLSAPVQVEELVGATQLAVGDSYSCAVVGEDEVYCWGLNSSDQICLASVDPECDQNEGRPYRVPRLPGSIDSLDAGGWQTCAVIEGQPWCWGRGLGAASARSDLGGLRDLSVGAGRQDDDLAPMIQQHACAVDTDGRVLCWGGNTWGQLGDGTTADRTEADPVLW